MTVLRAIFSVLLFSQRSQWALIENKNRFTAAAAVGVVVLFLTSFSILMSAFIPHTTAVAETEVFMEQKESDGNTLAGRWEGSFEFQSLKINMAVDFSQNTISIPQQGLQNYPIEEVTYDAPKVSFTLALGGGVRFTGERTGDAIHGTFRQPGAEGTFELTFAGKSQGPSAVTSGKGSPASSESEAPVASEEITLSTDTGNLYGTLTLPDRKGPVPLVLIIAGSGPTDRDGNSTLLPGKNNSLKMLAEGLSRQGVAAVRYDKRGIAASADTRFEESKVTFDTFIDDAVAWIEKLKKDSRFSSLGIIGHSEGSLIGMVAARRTEVQAFVSIAGSGQPIYDTIIEQLKTRMPEDLEEAGRIINLLRQGKRVAQVSPQLQFMFRPSVQPFLISMFRYDPAKEIARLHMPVLIVNGSRDIQIDVTQAKILASADPDAELCIIDGMNHVLKDSPEDKQGNLATYSNPQLPLAEGLLEAVGNFLKKSLH
jgi:pimeloyl-ACP methyl ester carboxylesterase